MANFIMQARSAGGGGDGALYTWVATGDPDFDGIEFPGPGTATDAVILRRIAIDTISSWTVDEIGISSTGTPPVIGGGGSFELRWRDVGGDREIEINFNWGTSPSAGTGSYIFPIQASGSSVKVDSTQLGNGGIVPCLILKAAVSATHALTQITDHEFISDAVTTLTALLGSPTNGTHWTFKFTIPRQQ